MICPICGANNEDGVMFCTQCGADITAGQSTYVQQQCDNPNEGKGLAIASLVLGILGVTICPSGIPSLLALIFGAISRKKSSNAKGMATAGFILGLVPIILGIIGAILYVIYVIAVFGFAGFAIIASEM